MAVETARVEAIAEGFPKRAPSALRDCDRSTLELALSTPAVGVVDREFYPDLASKAAVLLYTLAKSQACPEGNKRIALLLVNAFLAINATMIRDSNDEIASRIGSAAESDREERERVLEGLKEWLARVITSTGRGGDGAGGA